MTHTEEATSQRPHRAHLAPGRQRPEAASRSTGARAEPVERGPVIATMTNPAQRNVIGTHSGSYAVYRALAIAAGALDPAQQARSDQHLADRADRAVSRSGASRSESSRSIRVRRRGQRRVRGRTSRRATTFGRPSPSPRRTSTCPSSRDAVAAGRLVADGKMLRAGGDVVVTKAAIEPVWYLPGVARALRRAPKPSCAARCSSRPAACIPELVTRGDLEVFLPPIGGQTIYMFGDVSRIADPARAADRARARRVQRLGRVRLRHLHVPAVPDARDRGVRAQRAGAAAPASSSTSARKAARSAR